MQLGLLITQKCNAACAHCATSCGPNQSAALAGHEIHALMDQAADLTPPGEKLVFSISGGEPFLDFPKLLEMVRHGRSLGAQVTCVSNAYWAASDEKAESLLSALNEAGLSALGISTSPFHQRFIKKSRVERALTVAKKLGIDCVLKYAQVNSASSEAREIEAWAQAAGACRVEQFPVMPYLREAALLPPAEYLTEPGLPQGRCPIPTLTVREDGEAYSCCAPGGFVPFLSLGNAVTEGLSGPYYRFLLRGKQRLLHREGPIHFARAIQARGLGHLLRDSYSGICDLCAHIARDPRLADVADEIGQAYEQEYVQAALEASGNTAIATRAPA